jgi:4-hydroxy-tetrahydrodipicolinate reductase
MPINVLVNGAFGRMGQMTVKALTDHPNLTVVGQTGREYDLKKSILDSRAEVVVDFTHPSSVFANAMIIIEAGARPVIGTSGLTQEQIKRLKEECEKLGRGAIIAPNFSIGAVLMMKYAKEIVKRMPHVEIIEMHHPDKADSPSGTALRTAQLITEDKALSINPNNLSSLETIPGARGATHQGVPIHAVRLPGLLAHQQIIFGGSGETLTLRHDSLDRQCFMGGVCFACERVTTLDLLVYGLEELL